jgi:hypothetical protein
MAEMLQAKNNNPTLYLSVVDLMSMILAQKFKTYIDSTCQIGWAKNIQPSWAIRNCNTDWEYWVTIKYDMNFNLRLQEKYKGSIAKLKYLTLPDFKSIDINKGYEAYLDNFCYRYLSYLDKPYLERETYYQKFERYNSIRINNSYVLSFNINPKFALDSCNNYDFNVDRIYKMLHNSILFFVDGVTKMQNYTLSYITPGIIEDYFDSWVGGIEADGEGIDYEWDSLSTGNWRIN